ncbi:MAG: hypothetical protein WD008_00315 [Balneolaceae bacterium]
MDYIKKPTTIAICLFAIVNLIVALGLPGKSIPGLITGYFLGTAAVVLHYVTTSYLRNVDEDKFYIYFLLSLFVRFMLVGGVFIFILVTRKIDHLSFTVSFIISYIFHSVIDVILINQKISKQSDKSTA